MNQLNIIESNNEINEVIQYRPKNIKENLKYINRISWILRKILTNKKGIYEGWININILEYLDDYTHSYTIYYKNITNYNLWPCYNEMFNDTYNGTIYLHICNNYRETFIKNRLENLYETKPDISEYFYEFYKEEDIIYDEINEKLNNCDLTNENKNLIYRKINQIEYCIKCKCEFKSKGKYKKCYKCNQKSDFKFCSCGNKITNTKYKSCFKCNNKNKLTKEDLLCSDSD